MHGQGENKITLKKILKHNSKNRAPFTREIWYATCKNGVRDSKSSDFTEDFQDFAEDFQISWKISEDFQISLKISRFHGRFPDFIKIFQILRKISRF